MNARQVAVRSSGWLDRLGSKHQDALIDNLPLPRDTSNNISVKRSVAPTNVAKFLVVARAHPN